MPGAPVQVSTGSGVVEGFTRAGVRRFRGIPFAEPPVGPLRLRAPNPVRPWTGVRPCRRWGAAPHQAKGYVINQRRDEDCLTLNIVAPEQESNAPLPVMVFIYGGGYFLGSSATPIWEGSGLARSGCVYVSVNYRVGALGAFDLSSLSDADHIIESNLYLRDLVLALQWVHDNIGGFGGDPDNVTIFGVSAGASCVETLIATPSAAGLFHRAICQSTASGLVASAESVAADARRFAEILGAGPDNAAQTVLAATPAQLRRALNRIMADGAFPLGPSIDGTYLPCRPVDAMARGMAHRVPLIVGHNRDEARLFRRMIIRMPLSQAGLEELLAPGGVERRDRIIDAYPGYPSQQACQRLAGDMFFANSAWQVAETHSRSAPVYFYRYDFAPWTLRAAGLGPTHGTELLAVFGTYRSPAGVVLAGSMARRAASVVVDEVQTRWVEFASRGVPGGDWPSYSAVERAVMVFDRESRVESDPDGGRRRAWQGFSVIG